MDLHLAGRTAVVTGGSKGIGLATVRLLLAEGARVVAASRRETPELKETGATHVAVDLSTADGARQLADTALAELGGVDVLVNNVGIGDTEDLARGSLHNLLELSDDAWRHTFDLHFYSALWVSRALLPSLAERGGTVVNVSSVAARLVGGGPADYAVSKAALSALTKVIAEQFGGQGVRAVTVSPGPVSTGVFTDPDGFIATLARQQGVTLEEFTQQMLTGFQVTTGRVSTPEEVARLIAFAASPNNITGTEFIIDGGLVKTV
ncbi:SDR family oxidoreductase [Streptomyces sp. B1866]|uniref:SDR family oxidoreductase n=1 Tax=Streptomyces sp. B1866 TaxID=3075431 RepID=UPI00288D497E|nr:SDR family oxidoreductase [Streptomyces sp. B1866]MDT3396617.1 SDR family oxidoreductase [Streptomyces sp. B1866]